MSDIADKTKVITVFETFAGIGAQHKAIKNLAKTTKYKNTFKVIGTSEWDARAIISYALIHHSKAFKQELKKVTKKSLKHPETYFKNFFKDKTFSLNSKTATKVGKNFILKNKEFTRNLIAANNVNHNWPDINTLDAKILNQITNKTKIDLLIYSFPCQGLSIANMGRGKGIKEASNSTSNLIWKIRDVLKSMQKENQALPKYLLMENVGALLNVKNIKDWEAWMELLKDDFGYETYYAVLDSSDMGSIQKRKRVFGLSVQKGIKGMDNARFKKAVMDFKHNKKLTGNKLNKAKQRFFNNSNNYVDELWHSIPNCTPSRKKMAYENSDPSSHANLNKYFRTLTTKQDRHPNIGMIEYDKALIRKKYSKKNLNNKLNKRFVTMREGYQLMGFESKDFTLIKKRWENGILTKESLYRQTGNSISVETLEGIFMFIQNVESGNYV